MQILLGVRERAWGWRDWFLAGIFFEAWAGGALSHDVLLDIKDLLGKTKKGVQGRGGIAASRMHLRRTSQTTSSSSTALGIIEATLRERERQRQRQRHTERDLYRYRCTIFKNNDHFPF